MSSPPGRLERCVTGMGWDKFWMIFTVITILNSYELHSFILGECFAPAVFYLGSFLSPPPQSRTQRQVRSVVRPSPRHTTCCMPYIEERGAWGEYSLRSHRLFSHSHFLRTHRNTFSPRVLVCLRKEALLPSIILSNSTFEFKLAFRCATDPCFVRKRRAPTHASPSIKAHERRSALICALGLSFLRCKPNSLSHEECEAVTRCNQLGS